MVWFFAGVVFFFFFVGGERGNMGLYKLKETNSI